MNPNSTVSLLNHINYGLNEITQDLAGFTVAQIEEAFHEVLNLPPNVLCYVEGHLVVDKNNFVLALGNDCFFWRGSGVKGSDEFYPMTCNEAAKLFGVSYETIRRWILSGKLRGTANPLRTSLQACRELRDQLLVQPPPPPDKGVPRPYRVGNRQPWKFIDPDKSGKK